MWELQSQLKPIATGYYFNLMPYSFVILTSSKTPC